MSIHDSADSCGQSGFAMVNMTDGTDIKVGLSSLKLSHKFNILHGTVTEWSEQIYNQPIIIFLKTIKICFI